MEHSIEKTVIGHVAQTLHKEGIPSKEVADGLALLLKWTLYSHKARGDLDWNEQQPDLRFAFEHLASQLEPFGHFFRESTLPIKLSGASLKVIKTQLGQLTGTSAKGLAQALVTAVAELGRSDQMVDSQLGRLLAKLGASSQEEVMLHYDDSVTALVALEHPEKATLAINSASAYLWVLSDLLGTTLIEGDDFHSDAPTGTADIVISTPPFQVVRPGKANRLKSDEQAILRVARESRTKGVVCASLGVLFSRSATVVREELINENWLDAVIGLPKGALLNTSVAPVILVIDKQRERDAPTVFIDADIPETDADINKLVDLVCNKKSGSMSATASQTDLRKNGYDLTISRYKLGQATQQLMQLEYAVSLDGVAEIIRAQSLKDAADSPNAEVFLEASVRDISESGRMNAPEKKVHVDKKNLRRAQSQRLYPGDLLLAIKGSVGRIAFIEDTNGEPWVASQAFIIIRPTGTAVSSPYLYRYLASELIQQYIEETATGAVMKLLKAADVSKIQVPFPSPDLKLAVEATHKGILAEHDAIVEHRQNIQRMERSHWILEGAREQSEITDHLEP